MQTFEPKEVFSVTTRASIPKENCPEGKNVYLPIFEYSFDKLGSGLFNCLIGVRFHALEAVDGQF
jgi:hypothetical protein